jgi:hypothetical protein
VHQKIATGCEHCLGSQIKKGSENAAKFNRDWQQKEYRKDITQPNDPSFIKAYGAEQARERGWSESDIRKHS